MDGYTKHLKIAELKRELHSEEIECSDNRALEILAAIAKLNKPVKTPRKPKAVKEQYMDVLGAYVLDMHDHGRLVGTRNEDGSIRFR